jgi:hypothetical protein
MQLNDLELFALDKLLHDHEIADRVLHDAGARVLERVETRDGFFAVIELRQRLRDVGELSEREWKFKLKSPKRTAGYFVCWPDGESTLCLEAVISQGRRPDVLTAELFA